ncbi:MAG: hypothetical protein AB8G99_12660 [Planctomycetaceae bacterium]
MRNDVMHILTLFFLGATIVAGGLTLVDYSVTAGESGEPLEARLPSEFLAEDGQAVVVVVIHPQCPCTISTARELQRLAPQFPRGISVVVCAFCPGDEDDSWIDSSLVDVLNRVPNSRVVVDRDGHLAEMLGAQTSGHVLFYGTDGALAFTGGITAGRGHEGRSAAAEDLLAGVRGRSGCESWPVYGCALFGDRGGQP